jgi:hypothetical protein
VSKSGPRGDDSETKTCGNDGAHSNNLHRFSVRATPTRLSTM